MAEFLQRLQSWSVLTFLVSSMFAVGLTLTPRALLHPLRDLRLGALALALNFVSAPAFAWLLTVLIPLERGYAIGLLLLGGAAGAPFLPKVVQIARGDAALAAALMALLTAGTIVFLPLALPRMVPGLHASIWSIAQPLVLLIVLPLGAGMLARNGKPALAARVAPGVAALGNAALLLLFVLLVALNAKDLWGAFGSGAILASLLFFTGLFAGGWLCGPREGSTRGTLALATAARNFGAALVPATTSISDPKAPVMVIVGAIVCLVVSFCGAAWVKRQAWSQHPIGPRSDGCSEGGLSE